MSQSAAVAPTPQRWFDLGLLSFHVQRELSEISKMPTGVLVRLLYGKLLGSLAPTVQSATLP